MLASYIDHTLLKPDATAADIRRICREAKQYHFASVCIQPCRVPLAAQELAGSGVAVCTVVGFPHGANGGEAKAAEAARAIRQGASEIDMVISIGAIKDGDWDNVEQEIALVKKSCGGHLLKVILETALLTDAEIVRACQAAQHARADFVKTSTGFNGGGATLHAVALMRQTVGDTMGVKASGGIRDRATAEAMIQAGATRIGASSGVAICEGEP